jgi:hypothetical protein
MQLKRLKSFQRINFEHIKPWPQGKIMRGVCSEKQKAPAAFFCFYIIYFALYQTAV